ncbi:hypothetical protein P7K49_032951 [Saguinus oedipus]|uniref:Uncharacterized protein n=1 Tax=Saguinus oedipus TaxID=9490 RepID=A0ABQ9TQI7_SAGOE|nr:hypothetical protein P7K49_032951 [Saguinus oedipus]
MQPQASCLSPLSLSVEWADGRARGPGRTGGGHTVNGGQARQSCSLSSPGDREPWKADSSAQPPTASQSGNLRQAYAHLTDGKTEARGGEEGPAPGLGMLKHLLPDTQGPSTASRMGGDGVGDGGWGLGTQQALWSCSPVMACSDHGCSVTSA